MAAAIAADVTSPRATIDQVVLAASGLDIMDTATTPAPKVYIIKASAGTDNFGEHTLQSVRFSPDSTGAFSNLPIVFPIADTWTLEVKDVADDSQVATASLSVS